MEEKVTIRLIRNATLRIHYAGKEILVDPMLAGKGTLQSALGVYKTPRVHLTMPMNEIADGYGIVDTQPYCPLRPDCETAFSEEHPVPDTTAR